MRRLPKTAAYGHPLGVKTLRSGAEGPVFHGEVVPALPPLPGRAKRPAAKDKHRGESFDTLRRVADHRDVRAVACPPRQCFARLTHHAEACMPDRGGVLSTRSSRGPGQIVRPARATLPSRERCCSSLHLMLPTRAAFPGFQISQIPAPAGKTDTWIDLVKSNPRRRASGAIPKAATRRGTAPLLVMNHGRRGSEFPLVACSSIVACW